MILNVGESSGLVFRLSQRPLLKCSNVRANALVANAEDEIDVRKGKKGSVKGRSIVLGTGLLPDCQKAKFSFTPTRNPVD